MNLIPNTISAKEIQRGYRRIFEKAKSSKEPIIVLTNNVPDVAIIGVKELEKLYQKAQKSEVIEAMEAIKIYKKEKRQRSLKRSGSLKDLA